MAGPPLCYDRTVAHNFNPELLTDKDHARLLLGDTGESPDASRAKWLLADETINAVLAQSGFNEGVARLAEGLAARFAQFPDEVNEDQGVKLSWRKRCDVWLELAKRLRQNDSPIVDGDEDRSGFHCGPMTITTTAPEGFRTT